MVSGDRQRVIEANRSLRLIKNELESLLEKGVITDTAFDSINSLLPAEASLHGAAAAGPVHNLPTPSPSTTTTTARTTTSPAPALAATNNNPAALYAPPSYAQSTSSAPALPNRNRTPAPPPPDAKPVLAHARALYRYAATDARDCSFERDDRLAVHEYMNADWWMGRNTRTGAEGIFPRAYVVVVEAAAAAADGVKSVAGAGAGAGGYYQAPQQPQYAVPGPGYHAGGGYPAAPGPAQPYQGQGMEQQQQQQQQQGQEGDAGNKVGDAGKKIGKKLGNAAIFGAGATIGSNIVNSIF
ncbi:hypothetical protein BT67DRAFT_440067 [Trichocladium antarcticum]|uniref:SH3 domain-containing protein n=1 Tax=Trichocladium antarcticum TaxID=1450529 RepID=A0AAN6UPZ3_9PEZI|nr:hypothetical protein BT67DRAFT_440067 [Trichocladium antarcticum]